MKVAQLSVSVSERRDGPYVKACESVQIPHGECRVLKVGSLPCRFVKIVMEKGTPLRDTSKYSISLI